MTIPLRKATFLCQFFQYSFFILCGHAPDTKGTLADTSLDGGSHTNIFGCLSFLCLIGTIYFKKYGTAFEATSPVTYFNTFLFRQPSEQQHSIWLDDISIWDRITFQNEMVPSDEALFLHWKRSC